MGRVLVAIGAVALTVPAVIGLGAIAFAFTPILQDGVQPMLNFMLSAAGLSGVFVFLTVFGAPIVAVIAGLAYACFARRLRRDPPLGPRWPLGVGAVLGALALPTAWIIAGPENVLLRYAGPTLLGGLAGAAAGAMFWAIATNRGRARVAA